MLNKIKFFAISLLPVLAYFFFFIPNADAASTYTIYAYGSGYIMVGVLQSIASTVASGGFSLILKSVVLIGFLILFIQMLTSGFKVTPHKSTVRYFAAVVVIYSALLIPKVNVNVYDTVNNTGSNAVVVNNVPWGIGYIASMFSQFQYYMTTTFEYNFSTPNSIDLTNAGMGFQLTSENLVDGAEVNDPYLFQSFTQYVYNCILPGISTGNLSSQALSQAGSATATGSSAYAQNSLLGYAAYYTQGAGANMITTEFNSTNPTGFTTTCSQESKDIQTDFDNYTNNSLGPEVAGALGMTDAHFLSQFGLVSSSIYNMSTSATATIEQMAVVNQYDHALIASANLAGVNPTAMAYGSAMAQQNMNSSFAISGQLAGEYMPVVYGIFFALFLAFSLILIILMALPIGANYLKMYMELGLFLAIWPVLMAVYNYIDDLIVKNKFTYASTMGYSLNSAHSFNMLVSSQLGWMGYLSWGVPMMAYALVTGSTYAMVGAVGSMDSAGKSAASTGANVASSGNLSLGNDSLNNYGANSVNSVRDVSTGTKRNRYDSKLTDNSNTNLSGSQKKHYNSNLNQGPAKGAFANALGIDGATGYQETVGGMTKGSYALDNAQAKSMLNSGQFTGEAKKELEHMVAGGKGGVLNYTASTLNGKPEFASLSYTDGQQVASIIDGKSANTLTTDKGKSLTELGNSAIPSIAKDTPLGKVIGNKKFNGTFTDKGGYWNMNGMLNKGQAARLYKSGLLKGAAETGLGNALNSGKKHFNIQAAGNKGHITGMDIANKQGTTIATDGSYSNMQTVKTGYSGRSGSDQKIYNNAVEVYDGSVFSQVPGGISAGTAGAGEYKSIAGVTAGNNSLAGSGAEKIAGGWAKHYTGNTTIASLFKMGLGDKLSLTEKAGYKFLSVPGVGPEAGVYVANESYAMAAQDVSSQMQKQKSLQGKQINHLQSILVSTKTTANDKVNEIKSYQKSQFTMPTLTGEAGKQYKNFMDGMTGKSGNFNVKGMGKVSAVADPYAGYSGMSE